MRYKPEHKKETHKRIVKVASEEFRANGFDGVGIAKLMADLSLTHGGFYAHFSDKEQLVAEACAAVFDDWLDMMLKVLDTGQGFSSIIRFYLSEEHRNNMAQGCLLPALSAEVARRPGIARDTFTNKLAHLFTVLAERMPGRSPEVRTQKVMILFASLTGAVSLARATSDPELSRSILEATEKQVQALIEQD